MYSPVPATSVHRGRHIGKLPESLFAQVLLGNHRSHDAREGQELLLLAAQKGLRLEERDDLREKIVAFSHHENDRHVSRAPMIRLDPAAVEPMSDEVEDLTPLGALTDVELRNELPTVLRARVPLDRNVERAFSVYVARDVGIQPFLLINRTLHIVTAHVSRLAVAYDMNE